MNKKSKVLILGGFFFGLLLVCISLYLRNIFLSIGLVAFILLDGYIVTQKKFKVGTVMSAFIIIVELLIFVLLIGEVL